MPKFGPITFNNDYDNLDANASAFGPIIANGNLTIRSVRVFGIIEVNGNLTAEFVRSHGPLTVNKNLVSNTLKVNGPVNIKGNSTFSIGSVNGPLRVAGEIKAIENLKVNGPVFAQSVIGKSLTFNGPIDVKGTLEASERISIALGILSSNSRQQIKAKAIKAPIVEIRQARVLLPRFLNRLLGRRLNRSLPEVNVPIEADEVILNGVKYIGLLKAENIMLENGAEYTELLE